MIQLLLDYRSAVASANGLVAGAHEIDAAGAYLWSAEARAIIVEAAFLKVFISWESFLESTFLEFLVGNASAAGNTVVRYASPRDRDHAKKMLIGNQRFVDWANAGDVQKLGWIYLQDGYPFAGVLSSIHSDLMDLKTIRNAAAHNPSSTAAALDALASRKLSRTVSNITPSALLLAADPQSSGGETILGSYLALLDAAANQVVHA
jgi:hypothetical protein